VTLKSLANKGFPHKLAVICTRITQHPKQPALLLVHKALGTLTRAESLSCSLWAPRNLSPRRTPSETRAEPEDWMVLLCMWVKVWSAVAEGSWSVLHFFLHYIIFLRFLQPKQWEWKNSASRAKQLPVYFSKKRQIYLAKSLGINHLKMIIYSLSLMFFQTHVTFLLVWNRKCLNNVVGLFFYYKNGFRASKGM